MKQQAYCLLLANITPISEKLSIFRQNIKTKGVTKQLLWQEYRQQRPSDGYSYAQFFHRYLQWLGCQQRSMRQVHRAGEKLFVDYCGPTMAVVNPDTGEMRTAQIFVAVLGASNYTFACASWSQKQVGWLYAHVKAFEFFGGVPEIIVPDNLLCGAPHKILKARSARLVVMILA